MVRRHKVRVVIGRLGIDVVAARRLDADHRVAEARDGKAKGALLHMRIVFGQAPAGGDGLLHRLRQAGEMHRIAGKRQCRAAMADTARGEIVGRPVADHRHQRGRALRRVVDAVALGSERLQKARAGGRRVEADAIGEPAILVGIVGKDQRDLALAGRRCGQPGDAGGLRRDEGDAVRLRHEAHGRGLGERVARRLLLEGDGAGEDAPVDLGHHHMHGEIADRKPLVGIAPAFLRRRGEDHLQHRRARGVERRGTVRLAGLGDGEGGGVEDDGRRRPGKERGKDGGGFGLLQRGDEDGQRVDALGFQGLAQRLDRLGRSPLHQGPVEDDGGNGRGRIGPGRLQVGERRTGPARHEQAGARQGARRIGLGCAVEEMAGVAQQVCKVLRPALGEIAPEPLGLLQRHRRAGGKRCVPAVVARQDGEMQPLAARHLGQPVDAIGPVLGAAEQADDDQPRAGNGRLGIHVDRIGMRQRHQVGEAQRRPAGSARTGNTCQ